MIRRLPFLFFACVMGLASVLSLFSSKPVGAWSGNLPNCSGSDYNWNWQDKLTAVAPHWNDPGNKVLIGEYHFPPISGGNGISVLFTTPYSSGTDQSVIQFQHNSSTGDNNLFLRSGADISGSPSTVPGGLQLSFDDHTQNTSRFFNFGGDGVTYSTSNGTFPMSCVVYARGVTYTTNNSWNYYSNTMPTSSTSVTCSPLDVVCLVTPLFATIGDGFNAVARALVQSIAMLFSPTPSVYNQVFHDLYSFFTLKFGFLFYPLTFFIQLFNSVLGPDNVDTSMCQDFALPNIVTGQANTGFATGTFFGGDFFGQFHLCYLEDNLPMVWAVVTTVIKAFTIFGLVLGVQKKYRSIVQK